jgi:glycosyltransferase involved in cell wall biosynthesis
MPVYNGADFVRSSILSLLSQDYHDLELIISDNASTDDTEAICRELSAIDSRIRYYRNNINVGAAGNYNKVFELARGEFFKWAAHDDECHPHMIRRCLEVLEQAPDSVTMVYPLAELIDENGKTLAAPLDRIGSRNPTPHCRLAELLCSLNMCDPVFGLYRTKYLRMTRLIGPFFGADYVLLGELAMLGEIWEVDEVLFRLRAHPNRSMKANPGDRARVAWYSPAAARKLFVLPGWERMVLELMNSALRSSLSPAERLKCCFAIPAVHYWRRFRNAGGRMKDEVKRYLGVTRGDRASTCELTSRSL